MFHAVKRLLRCAAKPNGTWHDNANDSASSNLGATGDLYSGKKASLTENIWRNDIKVQTVFLTHEPYVYFCVNRVLA